MKIVYDVANRYTNIVDNISADRLYQVRRQFPAHDICAVFVWFARRTANVMVKLTQGGQIK